MIWQVVVAGEPLFDAASPEDAEEVAERVKAGNRWSENARIEIEMHAGDPDPTPLHDKLFWWRTSIQIGYAGWDCVPTRYDSTEQVLQKDGETKAAVVLAGSAMDAIAKSELMMYTVKGTAW